MSARKSSPESRSQEGHPSGKIRIRYSLDITRLEDNLLEHIASRPHGGLLDPILILVPTRQLLRYLKRRIVLRAGSALGVHVLTHRALAVKALEHALEVPPRLLGRALLATLMQVLAERQEGFDGQYLQAYAGVRKAVLTTFRELRESGVSPAGLSAGGKGLPPFLTALYERYSRSLEQVSREGLTDTAGLIRVAVPHVPVYLQAKGIRHAFHYGAYELIGVHLELLESVAGAAVTEFLLPTEIDGPAFGYASRFVELSRARGATVEPAAPSTIPGRKECTARIRELYNNESHFPEGRFQGNPALEIRHAQGAEAELRVAALRALTLHEEEGVPLEEIAIVARSLEPYAPFLETTLEELQLPFSSTVTTPLLRHPPISAFLCLLGALAEDLSRGRVMDLLRHTRVRFPTGIESKKPEAGLETDRWDRWSRAARIVSGIDTWRALQGWVESEDLPGATGEGDESRDSERAAERTRSVTRLLEILEALESERTRWGRCSTLEEHATFLRDLAGRYVRPESEGENPDGTGAEEADEEGGLSSLSGTRTAPSQHIERLLRQIETAGQVRAATRSVCKADGHEAATPESVLELISAIAEGEELPLGGQDPAGVRILDVMQARGLCHRVVLWIGFHDGSFPRKARPDPYLDDASRVALSQRTGMPLTPKSAGSDEERLLLAMTLSAARDRLILSFQRADESGRACARSSALREVARVFTGRADTRLLLDDTDENPWRPERISSHPGERARSVATSPRLGRLPPRDAVVAGAVRAVNGTSMAAALLQELSLLNTTTRAALNCVEAIELFRPPQTEFDGVTGIGVPEGARISPTALERLARCPLAFFLRHVLHLRELDEEAAPHRIEVRALGIAVHATLAEVYGQLESEGYFREHRAPTERAMELLAPCWRTQLQRAAGASHERLRGLFEILGDHWLVALEKFVRGDLDEIHEARVTGIEVERRFESVLPSLESLVIAGRLDRVLRSSQGALVDDYKTGGNVSKKLDKAQILKGLQIQLPLYREVASAVLGVVTEEVRARLLGVGPEMSGKDATAELKLQPDQRLGFLETVAVTAGLALQGRFVLWPSSSFASSGTHYCGYCGYRRTCRRMHEPTLERLGRDPELADFRDLRAKTSVRGRWLLEGVRAAEGPAPTGKEGEE